MRIDKPLPLDAAAGFRADPKHLSFRDLERAGTQKISGEKGLKRSLVAPALAPYKGVSRDSAHAPFV